MSMNAGGMSAPTDFLKTGATELGQAATNASETQGNDMMGQIRATAAQQMKFQTEMGIIQMIVKMNEALAKMFKAIGEAIKGLA